MTNNVLVIVKGVVGLGSSVEEAAQKCLNSGGRPLQQTRVTISDYTFDIVPWKDGFIYNKHPNAFCVTFNVRSLKALL